MRAQTNVDTRGRQVLVVENEPETRRLLQIVLAEAGYKVHLAASGEEALHKLGLVRPDAVVLALTLPDMNGLDLCQELREWSPAPILVVSATTDERIKVQAFDLGADDYITKPFAIAEFKARLRAAIRRASGEHRSPVVVAGELQLNQVNRQVTRGGQTVGLTLTEYRLLQFFMAHPGQILPYAEVLRAVWGEGFEQDPATLRVYIHHLRQKLEPNPAAPTYIHTVPRIGYRFASE
jgi:two-component system KDP operon response regulator KdpE